MKELTVRLVSKVVLILNVDTFTLLHETGTALVLDIIFLQVSEINHFPLFLLLNHAAVPRQSGPEVLSVKEQKRQVVNDGFHLQMSVVCAAIRHQFNLPEDNRFQAGLMTVDLLSLCFREWVHRP